MHWVERCYPDVDGRMRKDLMRVNGGVDLFLAAMSTRKVWTNNIAFKRARVWREHVEFMRATRACTSSRVISYKHMVIDLRLQASSILAGTEEGRILNSLNRGRSKSRYGKGKTCCCVLAFAVPLTQGVGRIDLS